MKILAMQALVAAGALVLVAPHSALAADYTLSVNTPIPDNNSTGVTRTFNMSQDMKLEHVELRIDGQ